MFWDLKAGDASIFRARSRRDMSMSRRKLPKFVYTSVFMTVDCKCPAHKQRDQLHRNAKKAVARSQEEVHSSFTASMSQRQSAGTSLLSQPPIR